MASPKYKIIQNELKYQIISGKFTPGEQFYTEAELMEKYNVSSITVVRALNELAKDGYIVRQQGKGSFVSRARKHKLVEFSDVENFAQKDDVLVLNIIRDNQEDFLHKLGLKKHQFYYKIDRIRKINDLIYIYHQSYIPEQYINPNYPNLSYYQSIYTRFQTDYHIYMNEENFEESNEVVYPTPESIASILDITPDFPTILQIKKTSLHNTGQILEYSETYKRGDFFKIKLSSPSTK